MSGTFGSIPVFDHNNDWLVYKEVVDMFMLANRIEESRRVPILLSAIGEKTVQVLRQLCDPESPSCKSYVELCEILRLHFAPRVSIYRKRIEFYDLKQLPGESINQWYLRIKKLAMVCNFGNQLENVLKDKLVTGLQQGKILDELCENEKGLTLTLPDTLETALNKEASQSTLPVGNMSNVLAVNPVSHSTSTLSNLTKLKCYACGKTNHNFRTCKFKKFSCKFCLNKGHITNACPAKLNGKPVAKKIYQVDATGDPACSHHDDTDISNIYTFQDSDSLNVNFVSRSPVYLTVPVEDEPTIPTSTKNSDNLVDKSGYFVIPQTNIRPEIPNNPDSRTEINVEDSSTSNPLLPNHSSLDSHNYTNFSSSHDSPSGESTLNDSSTTYDSTFSDDSNTETLVSQNSISGADTNIAIRDNVTLTRSGRVSKPPERYTP
ncbi:hypothetical protein M8J77_000432 [Diaphorina citri]|nr:hypothetical protein M8J77_000432 [Diaphorina citri]